jgi:hypothetical protein
VSEIPLVGDGPKKSAIISLAFEDLGMSDLSVTPEEKSLALRRLNTAMTEEPWSRMGYIQPAYGDGEAEEPSGIASDALAAVAQHLAMRLFATFDREPKTAFRAAYTRAVLQVSARYAVSGLVAGYAPGTIRGAGARGWTTSRNPYFPEAG